ncbi:MAG: ribosome biogenesis GTPase Der [Verrucomicrobiota bacterium]
MPKRTVAIVGRPNVGKSALFNRLSRKQISLVYDQPGVTRDRIMIECEHRDRPYLLIDTGGIGLEDASGFEEQIEKEVAFSIEMATDLLFVVDGREGIHPLDEMIADRIRRLPADREVKSNITLVINKMDTAKQDDLEFEFAKLGIQQIIPVSAAHGRGIQHLLDEMTQGWKEQDSDASAEKSKAVNVAIVGRPNAGKSSLINAILEEERVIVSPVSGTTRDAVDVFYQHGDTEYCLVDTAGMRKKRRIDDELERAMASRSAHSINRADLCVLVIDAATGVSLQEKKIAGLIHRASKPCMIVVNKWDLALDAHLQSGEDGKITATSPAQFKEQFETALKRELFFLPYSPVLFTSALKRKNQSEVLEMIDLVQKVRSTQLPGGQLNKLLETAMRQHTPPRGDGRMKRQTLKIFYLTQDRDNLSTPTIVAFLNKKALWTDEYQRYLEQKIRNRWPLTGCPIVWVLRDKPDVRQREASNRSKPSRSDHSSKPEKPARKPAKTGRPAKKKPLSSSSKRKRR